MKKGICSVAALPVNLLLRGIHRINPIHCHRKKLYIRYGFCTMIVFTGAGMATYEQHYIAHFLWDGIAYSIHGIGLAPICEDAVRILNGFGLFKLEEEIKQEIARENDYENHGDGI